MSQQSPSSLASKQCKGETCWPMYIYLVLAVPGAIASFFVPASKKTSRQAQIAGAVAGALWVALWAFIMWELCKHCHRGWAWFLLLLPVILFIGAAIAVYVSVQMDKKNKK